MSDNKCDVCGKKFNTHRGLLQHVQYCSGKRIVWSKGLTKETNSSLKKFSETIINKLKNNELVPPFKGKSHSIESKEKISVSLKRACVEGRLNNWQNKRKNVPSYPEIFFMKVIKNDFIDKNYKYELTFHRYSLDFAWPHIKKCIEIDGEQHYQFSERIISDIKKDKLLEKNGWKVLHIRWKDMFNDPQKWIKISKNFIEEDIEHLEDNLENYRKELEEKERIKNQKKIDQCHEIALKINALIDAKIDFSKWGYITKVSKVIGISPQKTKNWLKRNSTIE